MLRHTQSRLRGWASALLAAGLCGCLDNKLAEEAGGTPDVFIAQQRDFDDYADWITYEKEISDDHGGVVGKTTVYLNEMPPEDAQRFPVGTILVKTMEPSDDSRLTIHAMVKRGLGFNTKGALGWEYFELALNKNSLPIILWRGEDPPTGEMYRVLLQKNDLAQDMMVESSCNSCHAEARDGTFDDVAALLSDP
jgi:hypothetical protein